MLDASIHWLTPRIGFRSMLESDLGWSGSHCKAISSSTPPSLQPSVVRPDDMRLLNWARVAGGSSISGLEWPHFARAFAWIQPDPLLDPMVFVNPVFRRLLPNSKIGFAMLVLVILSIERAQVLNPCWNYTYKSIQVKTYLFVRLPEMELKSVPVWSILERLHKTRANQTK